MRATLEVIDSFFDLCHNTIIDKAKEKDDVAVIGQKHSWQMYAVECGRNYWIAKMKEDLSSFKKTGNKQFLIDIANRCAFAYETELENGKSLG